MLYTDHIPTTNPEVLAKLERWFRERPEILVRTRVPCSGREEFEFFSSFNALAVRMRESDSGTWFTIYEQPQLPLRGIVDDGFISRCLSSVSDGAEYLLIETVRTVAGAMSWFHNRSDESHAMLRDDLEDCRERSVAFGQYPPSLEERDDVIHIYTSYADGTVPVLPH